MDVVVVVCAIPLAWWGQFGWASWTHSPIIWTHESCSTGFHCGREAVSLDLSAKLALGFMDSWIHGFKSIHFNPMACHQSHSRTSITVIGDEIDHIWRVHVSGRSWDQTWQARKPAKRLSPSSTVCQCLSMYVYWCTATSQLTCRRFRANWLGSVKNSGHKV